MKTPLFLLLILLPFAAGAQLGGQLRIDSLLTTFQQTNNDTVKLRALNELARAYRSVDPIEGVKYAQMYLATARDLEFHGEIVKAHIALGVNYMFRSDYPAALENLNKALLLLKNPAKSPLLYSDIISQLGVIYQESGNYDKALECGFISLKLDIAEKDTNNIAGDYGNIGIIYMLKKDYEKALEYDFKSLELFNKLRDKDGIAHNYGNVGNVYKEYGNYVLALEYDMKALKMFRELGDNGGVAINLGNIGDVYLETAKTIGTGDQTPKVLPKGTKRQMLDSAISYFQQCIDISKKIGQLENILIFSNGLSEAYDVSGDYKKSLESYKIHVLYNDSVHSDQNKLRMARLETDREHALKEKQIQLNELERSHKQKERFLFGLVLGMLVIVIGIITRKFVEQKKRNRLLAIERRRHLDRIEQQKLVMGDIAYTHSHDVSGQVSTILGLTDVFNTRDYSDPDNKIVIDGIGDTAKKLDIIVKDMIIKENMLNKSKKN